VAIFAANKRLSFFPEFPNNKEGARWTMQPEKVPRDSTAISEMPWGPDAGLFLEALLALSLRGVGIVDRQGIIRQANGMCRSIFGLQSHELVGRHFCELYIDPQEMKLMLARARLQGRVDDWPIQVRDKDGAAVPVKLSLIRVNNPAGRLLGSVAMIQDARQPEDLVRQLQQQELTLTHLNRRLEFANLELARVSRLKSEFLASTSHELRTPLNSILGFLRLVLDGICDNPQEQREFLQNAYDSARNLLRLINELLDTARIEAGQLQVELKPVDIAQVFQEVEKLTRLQAFQKGLRLHFRIPKAALSVRADTGKLQQVLLNLVANAIKFTPAGEVEVKVRALPAKGHVRFQVRDSGIGIAPEFHRDLFQKFVQGDGSTTRRYGGTGLGLAICKNLVEFMGGQIWLASPGLGQGTTVWFTLPQVSPQPLHWRRCEDRERGFQIEGPVAGPLILVVEDEPQVRDIMTRILHRDGYRTVFAVTADDGLEGAKRLNPALITIDMGLPVRSRGKLHSGLDLYHALQQQPQTAGIAVILVTGHEETLSQATEQLPPILLKPFKPKDLLTHVAEQLKIYPSAAPEPTARP
jgi:PAS domain S-box-containing protein